jgi:hypothetical protein
LKRTNVGEEANAARSNENARTLGPASGTAAAKRYRIMDETKSEFDS